MEKQVTVLSPPPHVTPRPISDGPVPPRTLRVRTSVHLSWAPVGIRSLRTPGGTDEEATPTPGSLVRIAGGSSVWTWEPVYLEERSATPRLALYLETKPVEGSTCEPEVCRVLVAGAIRYALLDYVRVIR